MTTSTISKKQSAALEDLVSELKDIKKYLEKLLLLIPEESIKEYKNPSEIEKSYLKAIRNLPPQ